MPVNTDHWRGSIGLFQSELGLKTTNKFSVLRFVNYKIIAFLISLLLCHGGIKVNPRPKRNISKFSCCHWNINSILALQKYDIICISESFLDSSANEDFLLLPGYHLLKADHLDNLKKGGVCLCFKENLSLR